jgi:hypothetical protein
MRSAACPTACPPLEQAELMVQQAPRVCRRVFRFIVMQEVIDRNTWPLPISFVSPPAQRVTCSTAATQLESQPNTSRFHRFGPPPGEAGHPDRVGRGRVRLDREIGHGLAVFGEEFLGSKSRMAPSGAAKPDLFPFRSDTTPTLPAVTLPDAFDAIAEARDYADSVIATRCITLPGWATDRTPPLIDNT